MMPIPPTKRLSLSLSPLALKQPSSSSSSSSSSTTSTSAPLPPIQTSSSSYYQESNIHQDIKLILNLQGGGRHEEVVKVGETVQEIKRRLVSTEKIPANADFYFRGRMMLNPYSLNDIDGVLGMTELQIEVKVRGLEEGLKDALKDFPTKSINNTTPTSDITSSSLKDSAEDQASKQHYIGNGKDERNASSSNLLHHLPLDTLPPIKESIVNNEQHTNENNKENNNENNNENNITATCGNTNAILTSFVDSDNNNNTTTIPDSQLAIPSLPNATFDENEPIPPSAPKSPKIKKNEAYSPVEEKEKPIEHNNNSSSNRSKNGEDKKIVTLDGTSRCKCDVI